MIREPAPSALTKNHKKITIQIMLHGLNRMRLFTLLGFVLILVSASEATSLAEDTNASPTPTPAPTESSAPAVAGTPAASPTPGAPTPTLEQRVAGLEAYITNNDPTASLKDKNGNIPKDLTMATVDTPGPGHNGWMMTASALVLFMTLPGLALFYGGLVRRKNVLSVLAQCFGITGLVAVLWWAFGYSLVFGKSFGNPFYGGSEHFFPCGSQFRPEPRLWILGLAECLCDVSDDVRNHHACADRGRDR